jgi:hypothetical protein
MRNVAPSEALRRRANIYLALGFVIAAIGAFCFILSFVMRDIILAAPGSSTYTTVEAVRSIFSLFWIVALLGIGLVGFAIWWGAHIDNSLARITGDVLGQRLDNRYTFIRNISKLGTGYIDAVLIGPPGALVFRVLDQQGAFVNEGDRWVIMDGKGQWVPARINPTKEVVDDIKKLRDYLTARKLPDMPIFGVIVFIKDDPAVRLTLKEPVVPATHLSSLYNRLQSNYFAKERIDQRTVQAIIDQLYDV